MKKKIKILRIIPSLDPIFGGPSKTIFDSSFMLTKKGFKVDILTGEQKGSSKKNNIKNINMFKSNKIKIINKGKHSLGVYCFNLAQFKWLRKNRYKYDYTIVHGLWQFTTLMARILLKKKYFVFIHGQLDPWFKENFFKKIKKQIYWFLFEKKNLLNSKSILVTSKGEKSSLDKTFVNTNGIKKIVIRYGIFKPKINKKKVLAKFYKKFPKLKNKNFYLFLGRFHEKKGCETLIKSAKLIEQEFKDKILLAGPQNGTNYERKIKKLSINYNLNKKIIFSDMLINEIKWGAILASKAMVLSSHGENFGVSLVESMSLGRPVLTTNKVNIYKEILIDKAGFIANDNVNDFSNILKKFNKLKKDELKILSNNAHRCFSKNFDLSIDKKNSLNNLIKKNICVE
jgi:glycosyltransferase involved in cell wall biosynthesis